MGKCDQCGAELPEDALVLMMLPCLGHDLMMVQCPKCPAFGLVILDRPKRVDGAKGVGGLPTGV